MEKIMLYLHDNEYKRTKITHTRNIVRAILVDDSKNVCLLHIKGDDIFGHRDYFETPGGGVKVNESEEEAIHREIKEETGFIIEIIDCIGTVIDYYNLLLRKNINNYYLCKVIGKTSMNRVSLGDSLIENEVFLDINEAIRLMKKMSKTSIEKLVRQRELPILEFVKKHYF